MCFFKIAKFWKDVNFINYFFEIVVPQLLEYFKDNAKDIPYSLLSEVLINNKNYEKEVKEMIEESKEISKKYEEKGLDGLISNTGKVSKHHKNMGLYLRKSKSREEELEIELMKKDIEIARLKKGYNVKGVGQEKEFITTFNKNIK